MGLACNSVSEFLKRQTTKVRSSWTCEDVEGEERKPEREQRQVPGVGHLTKPVSRRVEIAADTKSSSTTNEAS